VPCQGTPISVRRLSGQNDAALLDALVSITADCVEGGASVGFMQPFDSERCRRHWIEVLDSVNGSSRAVFAALTSTNEVVGAVQVNLSASECQPHLANLEQLLVRRPARRMGVGRTLLGEVDALARTKGLTVLTAFPSCASPAEALLLSCNWRSNGKIPRFSFAPTGEICSASVMYKLL